jgi:hypothetical protein
MAVAAGILACIWITDVTWKVLTAPDDEEEEEEESTRSSHNVQRQLA